MSSVALPERCYAMDVSYPLLVAGTAEKHIVIIKCVSVGLVHGLDLTRGFQLVQSYYYI